MNDLALFGIDLFGDAIKPASKGPIFEKFTFPPFSILDAKQGEWQDRKDAWKMTGIRSEETRENVTKYSGVTSLGEKDVSIFDPVLCELIYRWFCMGGGK